ncbi:DMT family transporter [Thiohalobacter sp. IOR34]|uniref:DMT family transporter n=1 Tax=Thiohalobacter sp. IOR34 TaxID=3057176 RepID=UPI0025B1B6E0|nr:DMT family transporter [Thiohalobacter sp. IOR34]WJW76561.1 DMT family transporter [Thiohalobacter sp. IOR34]
MKATKPDSGLLPVLSLLFAATLWGVMWYPLRWLETQGMSGLWSSLLLYAAAALVGLPPLLRGRRQLREAPLALLVLALAAGWCNVAFILAVLEGTVVRVLLLFYLSPLWTVVFGWLLLGERLSTEARLVFLLALTGAMVMLWDDAIGLPWPRDRGDWLAVSSGVAFALANVMVRRLQQVSVWVKTEISWWGVILVALVGLLLAGSQPLPPADAGLWGVAVALGAIGIVVMTLTVQYGVTQMPVHRSAIILLFELVAGALSAYWLTDEVVQLREWLGGGLIIAAAWLAARMQTGERGWERDPSGQRY